jgi:hypothetical protein
MMPSLASNNEESQEQNARRYSHQLRVIGQLLERQGFRDYDVVVEADDFLVTPRPPEDVSGVRPSLSEATNHLTGRLGPAEIEKVEMEEVQLRAAQGGIAEFPTSSELLRTVGTYVENVGAFLLKVSKRGPRVTIRLWRGDKIEDIEQPVSFFYNLFIQEYLKRRDR